MSEFLDGSAFFTVKRPLTIERWSKILLHYTRSRLTRSSDKFVAIAGLAQAIQAETRDEFIAGMWRQNLENQLCWQGLDTFAKRITPSQAPTWSWASLHGVVESPDSEKTKTPFKLCVEVRNVTVEYASESKFGPVKSAILHLACHSLCHGTLRRGNEIVTTFQISSLLLEITAEFDCISDDGEMEERIYEEDENMSSSSSSSGDSRSDEVFSDDIYLLPVRFRGLINYTQGLLLQRSGAQKGQYRRIGYFSFSSDKFDELCRIADSEAVTDDYVGECWTKDGKMQRLLDLV